MNPHLLLMAAGIGVSSFNYPEGSHQQGPHLATYHRTAGEEGSAAASLPEDTEEDWHVTKDPQQTTSAVLSSPSWPSRCATAAPSSRTTHAWGEWWSLPTLPWRVCIAPTAESTGEQPPLSRITSLCSPQAGHPGVWHAGQADTETLSFQLLSAAVTADRSLQLWPH